MDMTQQFHLYNTHKETWSRMFAAILLVIAKINRGKDKYSDIGTTQGFKILKKICISQHWKKHMLFPESDKNIIYMAY